jgi:hypothetical protein
MLVAILVVLALILLGAIVYGLHRFQLREAEHNADRQAPLPPLDLRAIEPLDEGAEEIPEIPEQVPYPAPDLVADAEAAHSFHGFMQAQAGEDDLQAEELHESMTGSNWAQVCNGLKNQGRFAEALAVCEAHYPQWGAFNQASTVLRAWIRNDEKNGLNTDTLLTRLFLTAAVASFLHDRIELLPQLSPRQMKQLPGSAWNTLPLPYDAIGYAKLRLLGKADQKMMKERWGEPSQHLSVKEHHRETWQHLIGIYGDAAD